MEQTGGQSLVPQHPSTGSTDFTKMSVFFNPPKIVWTKSMYEQLQKYRNDGLGVDEITKEFQKEYKEITTNDVWFEIFTLKQGPTEGLWTAAMKDHLLKLSDGNQNIENIAEDLNRVFMLEPKLSWREAHCMRQEHIVSGPSKDIWTDDMVQRLLELDQHEKSVREIDRIFLKEFAQPLSEMEIQHKLLLLQPRGRNYFPVF